MAEPEVAGSKRVGRSASRAAAALFVLLALAAWPLARRAEPGIAVRAVSSSA